MAKPTGVAGRLTGRPDGHECRSVFKSRHATPNSAMLVLFVLLVSFPFLLPVTPVPVIALIFRP